MRAASAKMRLCGALFLLALCAVVGVCVAQVSPHKHALATIYLVLVHTAGLSVGLSVLHPA